MNDDGSPTCSSDFCGWTADIPAGVKLEGVEWWCGDEVCDCSEAQIRSYRLLPYDRWKRDLSTVWSGTFHTDGESTASADLNRMAQHLRRYHHDLYDRISWPWTRTG